MSKKHQHHGGAWKVAYADFITAMMALFLVLWLTAQDTKIKEAVERAFKNPFSAITKESTGIIPNKDVSLPSKSSGKFDSVSAVEIETMRRISEELSRILQQQEALDKTVQLELTTDGLKINIFDRAHRPVFKPDSDGFTTYGEWVFSTLAWEISRYKTFRLELEGHTERRTEGVEMVRKWELSTERANSARRSLVQNGVSADQVCKVSGYADSMPMPELPPTDEGNRRVTVLLKIKQTMAGLTAGIPNTSNQSP